MFLETARDDDDDDPGASAVGEASAARLRLELEIDDPDIVASLMRAPEGRRRNAVAQAALKIGVMAMRQAEGRIDVERVRNEGERLLAGLREGLAAHSDGLSRDVAKALGDYFDPHSGRFSERVERLVKKDGDLETALRAQIAGDGSALAQTLARHLGPESPIMRAVDPAAEKGLARNVSSAVEAATTAQRDAILKEFSLDNADGALARTVRELVARHGEAGETLRKEIASAVAEFSLDREDSALSRLVRRVDQAQRQISDEFSLDKDGSALARIRREVRGQIDELAKNNAEFQTAVMERLTDMAARKAESLRSSAHGEDIEAALFGFVQEICQKHGDVAVACGRQTGLIRNCKKGDYVIELGPEQAAAGARIVVEAKQDASYGLDRARAEIEEARKNRGADVGVFVHSARAAPTGLDPLQRFGEDVFVVWDSEEEASDLVLRAGLSLARALAFRAHAADDAPSVDLEAMTRAVRGVEKQAALLDDVDKAAQGVVRGGEAIEDRVRKMRRALARDVAALDAGLEALRGGGADAR
ncbi:MAG: hypothetical protein ACFB00_02975 [Parvularculaceae bacterium]